MSQDLRRKVALVTGAGSGIGRAMARAVAAEGMRVALVGRSADRLTAVADEIEGETLVAPADLTRPDDLNRGICEGTGSVAVERVTVPTAPLTSWVRYGCGTFVAEVSPWRLNPRSSLISRKTPPTGSTLISANGSPVTGFTSVYRGSARMRDFNAFATSPRSEQGEAGNQPSLGVNASRGSGRPARSSPPQRRTGWWRKR